MAFILKSNKVVIDLNNDYKYLTALGPTTKDIYDYVNELKIKDYLITQNEFDSLNSYVSSLKEIGAWNSFVEFLPLFGNNVNAQMVKLKYINNKNGVSVNNFNNANVDNGKGLIWNEHTRYESPCIDLGFTQNDVFNLKGFGSVIHSKYKSPGVHNYSSFFGAGVSYPDSIFLHSANINGTNIGSKLLQRASTGATNLAIANTIFSIQKWTTNKSLYEDKVYVDGISVINNNVTTTLSLTGVHNNTSFYLGATNVDIVSPNFNTEYSFYGGIRFFALHDASMSFTMQEEITNLTNSFILQSGKTFI